MAKRVDPDSLADLAEVAAMMGLSHQRSVSVYRRRYADFPSPAIERGRCVLWVRSDIEAWVARRGHT